MPQSEHFLGSLLTPSVYDSVAVDRQLRRSSLVGLVGVPSQHSPEWQQGLHTVIHGPIHPVSSWT
jgi:hypothetical protein